MRRQGLVARTDVFAVVTAKILPPFETNSDGVTLRLSQAIGSTGDRVQLQGSSSTGRCVFALPNRSPSTSRSGGPRLPTPGSISVGHTAQSRREVCTTPTSRHCRRRHAASRGDAARRHLLRALVQPHRTPRDPAKTHDMYFTFDDLATAHSPTYTSSWPPMTMVRSGGRWKTLVRSAALAASQRYRARRQRGRVGTSRRVRRNEDRK